MAGTCASAYFDSSLFTSAVNAPFFLKDKLSIFHLNARSLKNKYMETETYLESLEHKFEVLAFTETWFTSANDIIHFDGYKCEGVYRKHRRGGGTSLYLKNHLSYELLSEFSCVADSMSVLL